eukprot:TRINITY_DN21987_c0_g1_i2.p1 TRINITY_DN21987_c0_g1~~TRINITY_DN21987_c0_g1_i2.p1  ORF type:complete len:105 (+),score=30.06 TRINITY_DN21987_c0_g1_i2:53-367(+)
MILRPPRFTLSSSSAASDVYKRQERMLPEDHPLSIQFREILQDGPTKVNLSLSDQRCEGASQVAMAVFDNSDLTALDVSCNSIAGPGAEEIARILRYPQCTMVR